MKAERVRVSDVCEVTGGTTPSTRVPEYWDGDITWLSPVDLPAVGTIVEVSDSQRRITAKALSETSLRMLPVGSVVYSTRASIGKIGHVVKPLVTNQGFTNMIPGPRISSRYLAYVLKYFTPQIELLGNSTTFNEVSRTAIKNFQIPLPSLEVQREISDTLDTADALRRKDRELLQRYDELAQSIFYEMFGDPVRNEMGWEVKQLQSVCSKVTDGTHDSPERLTRGIKFITGKHIRAGRIDFDNSDYVTDEVHREVYRRCNPVQGDVLYTNIGVNLGTAAYNDAEFEFSMKNVALLKPDVQFLDGLYLQYLLNTPRFKHRAVSESGVGGAQQFLSLKQLRNLKMPIPPVLLQKQFHQRIRKVSELMKKASQTASRTNSLFISLMSSCFS